MVVSVVYILFPWQLSEEFVAHASNVNCAKFGRRTSRILITGGEDLKVNLWAVGKPSALLVISYRIFCRFMCIVILTFLVINYLIQLMSLYITEPIGPYKSNWVSELWLFWTYHRWWFCKWNNKNMRCWGGERYEQCWWFGTFCIEYISCNCLCLYWLSFTITVVRTFTGHRSNCASLDFHPFGEFLASGSSDTNMKIWDIRKKRCIHTYKGHTRRIDVLKFTPDGRWIVSGGADNSVKVKLRACTIVLMQKFLKS